MNPLKRRKLYRAGLLNSSTKTSVAVEEAPKTLAKAVEEDLSVLSRREIRRRRQAEELLNSKEKN